MNFGMPVDSRRLLIMMSAGVGLGFLVVLVSIMAINGVRFTVGWLLGFTWPYPENLHSGSAWVLICGAVLYGSIQIVARKFHPRLRLASLAAGPFAALCILASWIFSLIFYAFSVWSPDVEITGIRWVLDGPIINGWRAAAGWLLWHLGAVGAVEPIHFVDGSSMHAPGSVVVLGILNEATLACIIATILVVGLGQLQHARSQRAA